MLPNLVKTQRTTEVPQPKGFKPLGKIYRAALAGDPPAWLSSEGKVRPKESTAQASGRRYETKVQSALKAMLESSGFLYRRPDENWIQLETSSGLRWLQPDSLVIEPDRIRIVEIKRAHCQQAYWQLHELYRPALRHLFPGSEIEMTEIVRSFDPFVDFPSPLELFDRPDLWLRSKSSGAIKVLQWNL